MALDITFQCEPELAVLRVTGDFRLWGKSGDQDILVRRPRSVAELPRKLVLNLGEMTHVDSMGMAALVRVAVESSKRNLDLRLVMPTGGSRLALDAVRIFAAWPQFPTEEAARAAYTAP